MGFSLFSITAERKNVILKRVDINSSVNVNSVTEKEVNFQNKQNVLIVGFEFSTEYRPGLGSIKFVGEVLYAQKNIRKIVEFWEKEKKLPEEVDMEVKNFLFRKCLTLGINLSEQLQLPPPMVFPRIVQKREEEKTRYIG